MLCWCVTCLAYQPISFLSLRLLKVCILTTEPLLV